MSSGATARALRLGLVSGWDDERLGAPDPKEFAYLLHERALTLADDVYDPAAYELVELEPQDYAGRLAFYLRRRSWAEWFFGTVTPARQITLLPEQDVAMRLRLARQISDEVRHHDVFAREVKRLGGEWRITTFPAPAGLMRMHHAQLGKQSVGELAAANQYSGEVVLSVQDRVDGNILRLLLDEQAMAAIEDIESDEPAHIAIGRDLVRAHAVSLAERRRMAVAQEVFLTALIVQHVTEIESLGAHRIRPVPSFEPASGTADAGG